MNVLDVLGDVVGKLVDDAIIDDADIDDATECIARTLDGFGMIPHGTASRLAVHSGFPRLERKRIVDEYMAFSAEQRRSTSDLARKRNELGASYNQMSRWAYKLYGDSCLARNQPRSALEHIIDLLQDSPDGLRRVDLVANGVRRSSIPGAIDWGVKRGRLVCRKGSDGLYRYTLPDAPR